MISDVIDAIAQAIQEEDDVEIYTSGATNLLSYPELGDREKAKELMSTFEEKQALVDLIEENLESDDQGDHRIQVYIGSESQVKTMKDCSIVTAPMNWKRVFRAPLVLWDRNVWIIKRLSATFRR